MRLYKSLLSIAAIIGCTTALHAQVIINTGNPNIEKFKQEHPNAVIWEDGRSPQQTPSTATPRATTPSTSNYSTGTQQPISTNNNNTTASATVRTTQVAEAPETTDYPLNAIPGRCYARCYQPDVYEEVPQMVIDKPASYHIEKVPAKYETVTDVVVVKAAYTKTVNVPAEYELITEDELVTPAGKKWVKGKADQNCLSADPKDCEVLCLVETPAVYKKVTRKVEKTAAYTKEVEVPAVTKNVERKILIADAYDNRIEIPATYKSVMQRVLVRKGGYAGWKEVLCQQDITESKIAAIQKALIREGYDPGAIDNQMGQMTRDALIQFQRDKGLPVGNLNIETLNALGVQ